MTAGRRCRMSHRHVTACASCGWRRRGPLNLPVIRVTHGRILMAVIFEVLGWMAFGIGGLAAGLALWGFAVVLIDARWAAKFRLPDPPPKAEVARSRIAELERDVDRPIGDVVGAAEQRAERLHLAAQPPVDNPDGRLDQIRAILETEGLSDDSARLQLLMAEFEAIEGVKSRRAADQVKRNYLRQRRDEINAVLEDADQRRRLDQLHTSDDVYAELHRIHADGDVDERYWQQLIDRWNHFHNRENRAGGVIVLPPDPVEIIPLRPKSTGYGVKPPGRMEPPSGYFTADERRRPAHPAVWFDSIGASPAICAGDRKTIIVHITPAGEQRGFVLDPDYEWHEITTMGARDRSFIRGRCKGV